MVRTEQKPFRPATPGALARRLMAIYPHSWRLKSYVLNHVVMHVPFTGPRLWAMEALGVSFEDRRLSTVLLDTRIWFPEHLTIGADTVIGRECRLEAGGRIRIGRSVNISDAVRLQTGRHNIESREFEAIYDEIDIGDYACIYDEVIVLGGVSIGEGAVVMAGAVVSRDVMPWTVVGGIPARQVRTRPRNEYTLRWRPDFN